MFVRYVIWEISIALYLGQVREDDRALLAGVV